VLNIAFWYFVLTQTTDYADWLQHKIIPFDEFHQYVRNVVPGILAAYLIRLLTWNHYRKLLPPMPWDRFAEKLGIPTLKDKKPRSKQQTKIVLLASFTLLAIVFPLMYLGVHAIYANKGSLPWLMAVLEPDIASQESARFMKLLAGVFANWNEKFIGFVTGFIITWPAKGEYDDNQTYAAQRLVNRTLLAEKAKRSALHWYHHVVFWLLPPFHARYNDLLKKSRDSAIEGCGETDVSKAARRKNTWWRKLLRPVIVLLLIVGTLGGFYVLTYIRYDQDPLGISPVSLGWRESLRSQ
jgi:hypothetical protein